MPDAASSAHGRSFEALLAEGEAAPVDGWGFEWFAGRATEQRPAWGYARLLRERMTGASTVLDVQTGGGEVFAEVLGQIEVPGQIPDGVPRRPLVIAATEGWPPNVELARRALAPFGGQVIEVSDRAGLPFGDASFDLVISRHPAVVAWDEIARVLTTGGTYLSQQIGVGSHARLRAFLTGEPAAAPGVEAPGVEAPGVEAPGVEAPGVEAPGRRSEVAGAAEAAGLEVVQFRQQAVRTVFYDVAAVVAFLRKVVWTVPGFSVTAYRDRLADLHAHIVTEGQFVSYTQRLLVEARRPGGAAI